MEDFFLLSIRIAAISLLILLCIKIIIFVSGPRVSGGFRGFFWYSSYLITHSRSHKSKAKKRLLNAISILALLVVIAEFGFLVFVYFMGSNISEEGIIYAQ